MVFEMTTRIEVNKTMKAQQDHLFVVLIYDGDPWCNLVIPDQTKAVTGGCHDWFFKMCDRQSDKSHTVSD